MKWIFKLESLIITMLIFVIIWLFSIIPYKLIFLDPLAKAVGDFELNDIVFSKLFPEQKVDTNIVLVNIGNLNRKQIGKQIEILNLYNPKVIGIDVIFAAKRDRTSDSILIKSFTETNNLVLVGILHDYSESKNYYNNYIQPNNVFAKHALVGYANLPTKFGADSKTIRSFRPYSKVRNKIVPAFSVRVAEIFDKNAYQILINRAKEDEVINFRGNIDKFKTIDADELLNGNLNLNFLKDKIVLLGFLGNTLTQKTLEDIYFTPLNKTYAGRSYPDMYGVTIHANIISMILKSNYINVIPKWISNILAFVLCFINVNYIRKVRRKLTDYYGGIAKILIFFQTIFLLIINVNLFLLYNYKMSFTLVLVGLIFIPSTVLLYDNLLKHLGVLFYNKLTRKK